MVESRKDMMYPENQIYLIVLIKKTLTDLFVFKLLGAVGMAIVGFIYPVQWFLFLTGGLVFADFFTGLIAKKWAKLDVDREQIQSKKMIRTVYKIILYGIAILVFHGISEVLTPGTQLAYFCTFFIAMTEVQSIDENIHKVTGVSLWTMIKSRIKIK